MSKIKIITSFSKYNDAELEQKALLIIDSMSNNSNFPTPTPPIADINTAVVAFQAALTRLKEGGSKQDMLLRDQKRTELSSLLEKLAYYVQMTVDDDGPALASSGYSLSKQPEPIGILPKPQNFNVQPEAVGMIKLSLKAIKGAKSYQYEYRRRGTDGWIIKVHTKVTLLLTELESGVQYEFRVTAIGTAPQRVYSDVLSSFVL